MRSWKIKLVALVFVLSYVMENLRSNLHAIKVYPHKQNERIAKAKEWRSSDFSRNLHVWAFVFLTNHSPVTECHHPLLIS